MSFVHAVAPVLLDAEIRERARSPPPRSTLLLHDRGPPCCHTNASVTRDSFSCADSVELLIVALVALTLVLSPPQVELISIDAAASPRGEAHSAALTVGHGAMTSICVSAMIDLSTSLNRTC